MNSVEKEAVLHCLKSMIDEEVCEECPLYGTTGTDHCEKDCVRLAINALSNAENQNKWIPISERLPEDLEPVNITWVNHNPKGYYANIKDKPFTATGHYCKGRWYWYSSTCQDYLEEYGRCDVDEIDTDIEVTAWMELPEPYLPDINVGNMSEIPTGAEGSEKND